MVWEAADKGVFALLVSDAQTELQVSVDLAEEGLDLSFADKDERLGVVVDVPNVKSAADIECKKQCVEGFVTYRSHSRAQNFPWSKKAVAMSCECVLLHHL